MATKYQAEVNYGVGWQTVGSPHSVFLFAQENIYGPGGYVEQAEARGVHCEFRIVEVPA